MMEQHIWCTHIPPELDRSAPMFLCYFCPAAAHDFQLMQHHCIEQHGNPNGFLNLCLERAAAFSSAWTECFPGAAFADGASHCSVDGASPSQVQVEPRTVFKKFKNLKQIAIAIARFF